MGWDGMVALRGMGAVSAPRTVGSGRHGLGGRRVKRIFGCSSSQNISARDNHIFENNSLTSTLIN